MSLLEEALLGNEVEGLDKSDPTLRTFLEKAKGNSSVISSVAHKHGLALVENGTKISTENLIARIIQHERGGGKDEWYQISIVGRGWKKFWTPIGHRAASIAVFAFFIIATIYLHGVAWRTFECDRQSMRNLGGIVQNPICDGLVWVREEVRKASSTWLSTLSVLAVAMLPNIVAHGNNLIRNAF